MNFSLNLDDIKYVKIIYKDKDNSAHCVKAAIRTINDRQIYVCAKQENSINIKTPQEITLSFICENGLYRTKTELLYVEHKEPYAFFTIKTPQGIEYQQNREYFRVRMNEKATLYTSTSKINCNIYDISASGIRLSLDKKCDISEKVEIEINFNDKSVRVKAKFVRFDIEAENIKAAFHFYSMPENIRDVIAQKCIQKQLQDKRNSLK